MLGFDLETRTQQLIDECFTLLFTINKKLDEPYFFNTLDALQKKITYQLNVLSETNLLQSFEDEAGQLTDAQKTLNSILKPRHQRTYFKELNGLLAAVLQWQHQKMYPFIEEVTKPHEELYKKQLEHQKLRINALKQKKHIELFLTGTMNDYYQELRQKYPTNTTKQQLKFDKHFSGTGMIVDNKVTLLPLHSENTAQHLLALINDLLAQLPNTFWSLKNKFAYISNNLPKLIEQAQLQQKTFYFKRPRLSFIHPPLVISPMVENTADKFKRQNKSRCANINQQLFQFEHALQLLKETYSPKSLLKKYRALLRGNLEKLDLFYPAPFDRSRPYSIFADPPITNYDRLCAHYYDKIERIIQQKNHWAVKPNVSKGSLTNNEAEYPKLFNSLLNILEKTRHKLNLILQTAPDLTKENAILKTKVRALALLSAEVKWLTKYMSLPCYLNSSSIEIRAFIQILNDFLSEPFDQSKITLTPIDELYFFLFTEILPPPIESTEACYTASESLQINY